MEQITEGLLSFSDFIGKETHVSVTIDGHAYYAILDDEDRNIVETKLKDLERKGKIHGYKIASAKGMSARFISAEKFIDQLFNYEYTHRIAA